MNDLVQDPVPSTQSPRRKFSFRFPLGHHTISGGSTGVGAGGAIGLDQSRSLDESGSHRDEFLSNKFGASGRHFSDELKNVTDIQVSAITLTCNFSLTRYLSTHVHNATRPPGPTILFFIFVVVSNLSFRVCLLLCSVQPTQYDRMSTSECFEKSMEILKKPLSLGVPAACSDSDSYGTNYDMKQALDSNLVDIENKLKAHMDFHEKCVSLEKNNSSETLFGTGSEFDRFDLANFKYGLPLKYNKTSKNLSRDLDQLFGGRDKIKALANDDNKRKYNYGHVNCPSEYEFNTRLVDGGSFYEAVVLPQSAKALRGSCELYPGGEVRQRSLSFTEKTGSNVDALLRQSMSVLKQPQVISGSTYAIGTGSSGVSGHTLTRKSKSFKARTLRRLSYNPSMMLGDSSSSSSGSELEMSALSECDIRDKGNRRRMVLPRRSGGHYSDKLMYGSNSSIQSAPHFNYDSMSMLLKGVRRNQAMVGATAMTGQQLSDPNNINYQGGGGRANYGEKTIKSVFSFDRIGQQDVISSSNFKWPEKIHGSTVKQNDMFWNKCRELKQSQAATRYMDSSSSSSGNTVNIPPGQVMKGCHRNLISSPMPPSPARD